MKNLTHITLIAIIVLIVIEATRAVIAYDISDSKNLTSFITAIITAVSTSLFVKFHETKPKDKKRK